MKANEQGRSMVEMLGVLAIIGVLSIGGIAGYTMAMNRYKANELLDLASKLSVAAQTASSTANNTDAWNNIMQTVFEEYNMSPIWERAAEGPYETTYTVEMDGEVRIQIFHNGIDNAMASITGRDRRRDSTVIEGSN